MYFRHLIKTIQPFVFFEITDGKPVLVIKVLELMVEVFSGNYILPCPMAGDGIGGRYGLAVGS